MTYKRTVSDRDRYYQFTPQEILIGDEAFTFFTRPALGKWQERLTPALLLAEWAGVSPQAQVLHMYCGTGLAGTVVAQRASGGRVTLLDSHGVAVEAARHTLDANHATNAEAMLSDCAQAVCDRTFDNVLALLPKSRAVWEQTILDAATVLRVGGDLYLAGASRSGIKSATRFVERVFGNVYILAYRGGCRVVRAVKEAHIALPPSDYYVWREMDAEVDDEQLAYVTKPGLFSWEQLDEGARLLIKALHARPLRPDDQVLDIGCGSGVLTLVAARQARNGHVTGTDVDCRAVDATRRTLALNEIVHAEAMLSDCGEAVQAQTFTVVVTNPPFHQERATTYAIAEQVIRDAARLLQRRGRLYLVANSFLKYKPIIEDAFGNAEVLRETGKFKVWHAIKR